MFEKHQKLSNATSSQSSHSEDLACCVGVTAEGGLTIHPQPAAQGRVNPESPVDFSSVNACDYVSPPPGKRARLMDDAHQGH